MSMEEHTPSVDDEGCKFDWSLVVRGAVHVPCTYRALTACTMVDRVSALLTRAHTHATYMLSCVDRECRARRPRGGSRCCRRTRGRRGKRGHHRAMPDGGWREWSTACGVKAPSIGSRALTFTPHPRLVIIRAQDGDDAAGSSAANVIPTQQLWNGLEVAKGLWSRARKSLDESQAMQKVRRMP